MNVNLGYDKDFKRKYRIENARAIGFGRFSSVFVAIDVMTSRAVAVKRIDKMQVQMNHRTE